MGCLFCGKEIGPIRILRDSEFCSPKHRKQYKERLQKVLIQVGEPDTTPSHIAPFLDTLRPHGGASYKAVATFDFSSTRHSLRLPQSWSLAIPNAGSSGFARLEPTGTDVAVQEQAWDEPEAIPYFGSGARGLLSLPQARLGAALLRPSEDRLLSDSIALPYPDAETEPATGHAETTLPLESTISDLALPGFSLSAAECEELAGVIEPPPSETWMATPEPEPVGSTMQPILSEPLPAALAIHAPVDLPEPAAEPEPASDELEALPPVREQWMPALAAEPAARSVQPVAAEVSPTFALPVLAAPDVAALAIPSATVPSHAEWMCARAGEPATQPGRPGTIAEPVAFSAPPLRLASLKLRTVFDPQTEATDAGAAPAPTADVQSEELAPVNSAPISITRGWSPQPTAETTLAMPFQATERPQSEVPQADLLALDYHSPQGPVAARPHLFWDSGAIAVNLPRFAVRPIFDRLEDQSTGERPGRVPAFAEIFTLPDAAALAKRKAARHAFTAIAASVTVAMALWFGANAGKFGRDVLARGAAEAAANMHSNGGEGVETASARQGESSPLTHPVQWVRTAAAKRATVQLGDSFENGMAAWGVKGGAWAAGWSHSRDGYVRPGSLALYQPSLAYADYRMEFFGQIENKSLSWAVRGTDTQNYYAMRFKVVEPGLRPVISMVHYPVVGGKQGHTVSTPLSVMVHNNTPYHVSVEVRGGHYKASIEGQEVDSWSDDTLLAGGVGFFSEAGARARIYWMKVTKNDDWLGWLCTHIAAGGESGETAWVDRPGRPVPAPVPPLPAPAAEPAPFETAETQFGNVQRGRGSWKGEIEKWSS